MLAYLGTKLLILCAMIFFTVYLVANNRIYFCFHNADHSMQQILISLLFTTVAVTQSKRLTFAYVLSNF